MYKFKVGFVVLTLLTLVNAPCLALEPKQVGPVRPYPKAENSSDTISNESSFSEPEQIIMRGSVIKPDHVPPLDPPNQAKTTDNPSNGSQSGLAIDGAADTF